MKRAAVYMRVSTREQTLENQAPDVERMLAARGFSIAATYSEQESTARRRPELEQMLDDARAHRFDVVLVWALDRLGRSMREVVANVLELERIGVDVLSAREPWLDTSSPVRPVLVSFMAWIAEQEKRRLVERTMAGLDRARAQGKKLGRPRASFPRAELEQLIAANASIDTIARRLGCSRATAGRLKKAGRTK